MNKITTYVADFETTVPELCVNTHELAQQERPKVYAYAYRSLSSNQTHFRYGNDIINQFMIEMLSMKTNGQQGMNLIFHNAQFDTSYIMYWLLSNDYKHMDINSVNINYDKCFSGRIGYLTVYHKGRIYNFIDSFKLYPSSLKSIGEVFSKSLGLDLFKGDTPHITDNELNDYLSDENNIKELEQYTKQDVDILWYLIKEERLDILLENKINTIANYAYLTVMNENDIKDLITNIPYQYGFNHVKHPLIDNKYFHYNKQYFECTEPVGKRTYSQDMKGLPNGKRLEKGSYEYKYVKEQHKLKVEREKEIKQVIQENKKKIKSKREKYKDETFRLPKGYKWSKSKLTRIGKIRELDEMINHETDEDTKQYLIKYKNHLSYTHSREYSNQISKGGYGGGLVMVNPNYMGRELEKVYVYDITSMYPYIYSTCQLPGRKKDVYRDVDLEFIKQLDELYHVEVNSINMTVKPCKLPIVKHKHNNENLSTISKINELMKSVDTVNFYNGEFKSLNRMLITKPEFEYILENYNIHSIDINRVITHYRDTELERKFKNHCDKYIRLKNEGRENGDKALEIHAKLMLNSPYGKLGNYQKEYSKNEINIMDNGMVENHVGHEVGGLGVEADVAAASFITAYGRTMLGNDINKVGLDNFVYCDTDSIHVLDNDVELTIGKDLGEYSLDDVLTDAIYLRPKTYGGYSNGEWTTTTAGISYTVEKDKFKVGEKVMSKTSTLAQTGRVIYDTLTEVAKINPKYDSWQIKNKKYFSTHSR